MSTLTIPASELLLIAVLITLPCPVMAEDCVGPCSFTEPLAKSLEAAGRKLVALAEEIPADKYSWRPSPEVRSVSEVFMHVVAGNFQLPADIGGGSPDGIEIPSTVWELARQRKQLEEEIVDKRTVVEMLRSSFSYAVDAIPSLDDLDSQVTTWGFPASKRDYLLILQGHAHEHLGQAIAYTRGLGITPPWSRKPETETTESVAEFEGQRALAEIESINNFGNLLTTFVPADLETIGVAPGDHLVVEACGGSAEVLYGEKLFDVRQGEWVIFVMPDGRLAIAISYGSAAETLGCYRPRSIVLRPA